MPARCDDAVLLPPANCKQRVHLCVPRFSEILKNLAEETRRMDEQSRLYASREVALLRFFASRSLPEHKSVSCCPCGGASQRPVCLCQYRPLDSKPCVCPIRPACVWRSFLRASCISGSAELFPMSGL